MRFFPTVIASLLGTLIAFGVAFFLFVLMLAGLASTGTGTPAVRPGSVLMVPISGFVPESTPENPLAAIFGRPEMTTLHQITAGIRKAAGDERISAIWLKPRGSMNAWASLEEIRSALVDFRTSGKLVIASSGATGFSERDYFLASAADRVFSAPAAGFELNGFVIVLQFMRQLLDKLDINVEAIRAGNFKSAVEPFTRDDPSDENRQQIQAILDAHSSAFTQAITEDRELDAAELESFIRDGSVTSAERAFAAGLVDSLLVDDDIEDLLQDLLGVESRPATISIADYPVSGIGGSGSGSGGTIAVVNVLGTIMPGQSDRETNPLFGGSNVGSETLSKRLHELREDDSVDAVVIRINSPGGSADASDVIWRAIRKTAEVKPVIASMGDVAASGGYYIAAAADTIVADPTTITGSIGVFSLLLDVSGLLEDKIGLTHEAVTTGPYADMFTGLRQLTDQERKMLADDVDETYERFTGIVADERSMDIGTVLELAQGRVWAGSDAKRLGLVDTLGGLATAVTIAAEAAGLSPDDVQIRVYPRPRGLLEALTELMEATTADALAKLSPAGPAGWFVRHVETLQVLRELHGNPQALLPVSVVVE